MYTDSHCHLNFPELQSRLTEIRQDMHAALLALQPLLQAHALQPCE